MRLFRSQTDGWGSSGGDAGNTGSKRSDKSKDGCPVCNSTDVTMPVTASCGHVFCYVCHWNYTNEHQPEHSHAHSGAKESKEGSKQRVLACPRCYQPM
mmetsp:Transcript_17496/g.48556  ORF Transcript_17496/g.48556 Transcript_17496/m.48556 type:complete len:98 (-) Transcript_17496:959-1252(-)